MRIPPVAGPYALLLAAVLLAACSGPGDSRQTTASSKAEPEVPARLPTAPSPAPPPVSAPADLSFPSLMLEPAFPNLPAGTFGARPLFLTYPPDESDRAVVVNQDGQVFIVPNATEAQDVHLFLDISDRVSQDGSEEGLLGLAFHPDYTVNGMFYVNYSAADPRRSVVSRFTLSRDPDAADPTSEVVILEVPQPFSNHNGGMLAFGPDGYLYVGLGDGGDSGDPLGHGQDLSTLLGSILRIDVDREDGGRRYDIPPDNPFVDGTGDARPEIWAYGLRNPWRFSFDRVTGDLWAADVGQDRLEEVDLIRRGGNYGWNVLEGGECYRLVSDCLREGPGELPVAAYYHNLGCSVTGGYVYRGKRIPALQGAYLYGDFCSGRIWGFRYEEGSVFEAGSVNQQAELADTELPIASFGEDADGELYVLAFDGQVYRLLPGAAP
ncbi:MAG: glucose sorbosone dehydrogenase [Dehalococcoidia bacterium]|nr:glucose sorbosone dehydrogenase [Dehalococcoidia bacterium]